MTQWMRVFFFFLRYSYTATSGRTCSSQNIQKTCTRSEQLLVFILQEFTLSHITEVSNTTQSFHMLASNVTLLLLTCVLMTLLAIFSSSYRGEDKHSMSDINQFSKLSWSICGHAAFCFMITTWLH